MMLVDRLANGGVVFYDIVIKYDNVQVKPLWNTGYLNKLDLTHSSALLMMFAIAGLTS